MRPSAAAVVFAACLLAVCAVASSAKRPEVYVSGTDPHGGSTATDTTRQLVGVCPGLGITLDSGRADFTVVRDIGPGPKQQKLTVFDHQHELIYAGETFTVRGAAQNACRAIRSNSAPAK